MEDSSSYAGTEKEFPHRDSDVISGTKIFLKSRMEWVLQFYRLLMGLSMEKPPAAESAVENSYVNVVI